MNLSTCRHNSPGDGKISFPKQQSWNPMTEVATIAADVDGKRILCRISSKDLQKKYHASAEEPMETVTNYRSELESAARILIENKDFEDDGSIVITYKDL